MSTFMVKLIVLILMIEMHILADYKTPDCLQNFKQQKWWKDNFPNKDWWKTEFIVGLGLHAFQWALFIMIPPVSYTLYTDPAKPGINSLPSIFILNILIHAYVDHLKANKGKLSLIEDQLMHFIQIIVTWILYMF